ncbi:hypothetical protein [Rheinheimera maricola]|uniref:Ig-like domain-containing protein n=1 Tax=Rheinheimera maricola TaxID=2793282 RepID=A0ABS7X8E7_9GAMM|nr:hypothetical protein [Rheinheimera maricola]MBZ9611459.1 hypothetical protein [Rheinheimera maricola]
MKIWLLLLSTCFAGLALANDKDQTLIFTEVTSGSQSCISAITVSGVDNCKTAEGKRGDCEGIVDCVCSKPAKHIEWQGGNIKNFTVYFYGDTSPFKDNCKLESNNQGKLKCRIKGDASGNYDYGVKVPGCDDFDPRIIIKQN